MWVGVVGAVSVEEVCWGGVSLGKRQWVRVLAVAGALPKNAARTWSAGQPAFVVGYLDLDGAGAAGAARFCLQQKGSTEAIRCSVERAPDRNAAALPGDIMRT